LSGGQGAKKINAETKTRVCGKNASGQEVDWKWAPTTLNAVSILLLGTKVSNDSITSKGRQGLERSEKDDRN